MAKTDKLKDSMGRARTMSLFKETLPHGSPFEPVYTLGEKSVKGLPSAKEIYMQCSDPTEYKPAMKIVGNWQVWQRIVESEWMAPYIEEWREELEIKLRSEYLQKIADTAESGNETQAFKAMQFMYKESIGDSSKPGTKKRGRPTKAEVARERKVQAQVEEEAQETLERLGINKTKKSKKDWVDA